MDRPKRPFWMHQVAEYVVGLILVAQGLQSPTPLMPALAGGLIMLNAAIVRGPVSAFSIVHRRLHRILDVVVMVAVAAGAVQPWVSVEGSTRFTMLAIVFVMGFVWMQTNFAEKRRERNAITVDGGRGAEIGRLAGRMAGDGVNLAKRLKKR